MSVRRLLASLGLVLVATGCGENLSSPIAVDQRPRFLQWTATTRPEFTFEGAHRVGPRLANLSSPAPAVVIASSSANGTTQQLSWLHGGGTGPHRLLLVSVSLLNASRPVTGVTYQGTALTFLGARNNSDNAVRVELWYLRAPATGSGTVVVKTTASDRVIAGALTFSGVDPTIPLGPFVSAGGTSTSTSPSLTVPSAPGEVIVDVVVAKGEEVSVSAGQGQTQRFRRTSGESGVGAGSSEPGAGLVTMSWTKDESARWAMAAVSVKPVPLLPLLQYQATVWLVRGQSRTLQINYLGGNGTSPFVRLTATDPTWVPGRGTLAVGDSVLVTATVDPNALAVTLEPHGMLFGTPGELRIWYAGSSGDLNGDGAVDATDAYIESQLLGMWYQAIPGTPWFPIPAAQSLEEKSFSTGLWHFSGYSVAW